MIEGSIVAYLGPGPLELLVIVCVAGVCIAAPILIVLYVLRLLHRNKDENTRLRLEVAKLADELEQVRRQHDSGGGSPPPSG